MLAHWCFFITKSYVNDTIGGAPGPPCGKDRRPCHTKKLAGTPGVRTQGHSCTGLLVPARGPPPVQTAQSQDELCVKYRSGWQERTEDKGMNKGPDWKRQRELYKEFSGRQEGWGELS